MNLKGHKSVGYTNYEDESDKKGKSFPMTGENLGFSNTTLLTQHKLLLLPSGSNLLRTLNISPFIFFSGAYTGPEMLNYAKISQFPDKTKLLDGMRGTLGVGLSMAMSWTSIEAYFNLKAPLKQKNEGWVGFQINFGID